jgi:AmmeMemoRadiSam system protein B
MQVRRTAVAGTFYPASAAALKNDLSRYVPDIPDKRDVKGLLAPHAGYIYSGAVAGETYAGIRIPRRVIILCPNHSGLGAALAVMDEGAWETPLGDIPLDEEVAHQLKERYADVKFDSLAHSREHSLEVHLPFLQYLRPDVTFVPICLGTSRLTLLLALGDALADVVAASDEPILLVASSDMSHFEPDEISRKKDSLAIAEMKKLDPEGLHRVVNTESISMCGYAPAVAVMQACRRLGATRGDLVRYATSGDVSGDYSSVVGYAGIYFC